MNVPELEFPASSVAVTFTSVVPIEKTEPEGLLYVITGFNVTLSEAVAEPKETIAPDGLVAEMVIFCGTLTEGGSVSETVILKVAVPVLLALSVAVTVTSVVPIGNIVPLALL